MPTPKTGKPRGRPKGTTGIKHKITLDKEQGRELARMLIQKHMEELIAAQLANAKGLKYLVTRDKLTGKFIKVDDAMLKALGEKALDGDDPPVVEVWQKDPSIQAFTDLMNRAIDKPKEQMVETNLNIHLDEQLIQRLASARRRLRPKTINVTPKRQLDADTQK